MHTVPPGSNSPTAGSTISEIMLRHDTGHKDDNTDTFNDGATETDNRSLMTFCKSIPFTCRDVRTMAHHMDSDSATFSMTSSMENAIFREDAGRRFQATNDDYSLPADELEFARLDYQHFGLKARASPTQLYHDKNYLAPIPEALKDDGTGQRKRGLDIGAGTGIWAIEMAQEFPSVDWTALDLIPVQRDGTPDNLHFMQEDASIGIGFPDDYFDCVHARALIAGMRNWPKFIEEVIRVTRPGGLVVFIEPNLPMGLYKSTAEETRAVTPGAYAFADVMARAFTRRGYDINAASKTILSVLKANDLVDRVEQVEASFPCSPWAVEPNWKKSGIMMKFNAISVPETTKVLIMDAMEMPQYQVEALGKAYVEDIEAGHRLVYPIYHNWAWKKGL
ncbi:hypothetical protein BD324DRAFT_680041 [Kockovaella imperatae]|uniref:S-adenosyl-L-methionine-dependent methyltransferase n=1 Tax=Kockovaella imperatae TaxID=4999 RepID=A0A1Y1UJY0_9TREE|nr:hypothetical protein BD324DRAFT_680041 [Kockovaella imperatae]ORX38292.1 hypothetical protein BD324DRAFT_680041 [Kockovaella imperatae]